MEFNKNNFEENKKYNVKSIMAVLLFGGFLSLFNESILNVALPVLMEEMHVTATTIQWLATGYVLIVAILIPITAFLIHSFNTKPLFLSAMLLFLAGILFAVFSTSFTTLLISRMIQATGTGMLIPIMMNTALVINPPEKRGSAMGLCVCAILVGPALDPIVSGTMLLFFNWKSLFILPLILQNGLHTSSLTSALVLLPTALIDRLLTPIAGKIFDKFGGKVLIPVGLFIMCIFMWLLSHIGVSTPIIVIAILYSFVTIGVALSLSPSQTSSLNQLSIEQQTDGVAITNTAIQIASAIGSTLFIGLMTAGQNKFLNSISSGITDEINLQALYSGFSYSVTVAVIVIAIGFILSLFLRRDVKKEAI
ncbi:MFS transporter [Clostridium gasigenes]|uniref:MFS transporter n=1 Tax=Clostridium gasigenes TaxID=94869 RepID=UPI001C0B0E7D|nr:MFS transporter [Clostridium gasigenes]MBU3107469.1 MFS transporter [Clostridium gasigenes]